MPIGRVLDVWSSNIPEVASLGNVGSNAYIRFFDQNNRTGKAVALGVTNGVMGIYNMSTGSNASNVRLGVGTSNPGSTLDVVGGITALSLIASIDGSNIKTGYVPKERLEIASNLTTGTYGVSNFIPRITVDTYGRVTAASNVVPFLNASNITTGTFSTTLFPLSGVTATTYGTSNVIPRIAVDDKGRVTSVVSCNVSIDTANVTTGIFPITRGGTGFSAWSNTRIPYASGTTLTTSPTFVYTGTALGVGTATPTGQFHVVGNAYISGTVSCSNLTFFSSNNSFQVIEAQTTYSQQIIASNMGTGPALYVVQGGTQPLADFIDFESGIAVRIANNGNTGFGTSNVLARVHITTSNTIFDPLRIETGVDTKGLIMTNDGRVGIGTFIPDAGRSLHVFGTSVFSSNLNASENVVVQKDILVTGGIGIGGTTVRVPTVNELDIYTGAAGSGLQVADANNSNIGVRLVTGTGSGASTSVYNGALDVAHGLALYCRNDGVVRHVFNTQTGGQYNSGSLGLGIAQPGAKLDIDGDARTTSNIDVGTYLRLTSAGTAAAPSVRLVDAGAGIYRPAANELSVATNTTERIRVSSSGNVGIGSVVQVAPASTLHLQGSNLDGLSAPGPIMQLHNLADTTGGAVAIDFCTLKNSGGAATPMARVAGATDAAGVSGHLVFSTRNLTNATVLDERIRMTSSGQLGVGVTAPQVGVLLQVAGAVRADGNVMVGDGQNYSWVGDTSTFVGRPATGVVAVTCGGGEKFRVTSNGDAGFFTTNPSGFQVNALSRLGPGGTGGQDASISGGGPFLRQGAWSVAGSSHTIAYPVYCMGDNSAGILYIQAALKNVSGGGKAGNAMVSFVKHNPGTVDAFVISLHKSATMSVFSVTTSGNDLVITTDAGCSVCWTSIGGY